MDSLRIPPNDASAELALLGAIVLDPSKLDELHVRSEDFYQIALGTIFSTVASMAREGTVAIDAVTICDRLLADGKLGDVGGPEKIAEVMEFVPHSAHAKHYAAIVTKKARQRAIIHACSEAIESAYDDDPDKVTGQIENAIIGIREAATTTGIMHVSECVTEFDRRASNPASVYKTGLIDLDHILQGGLRGSNFVIIAGRPGSGKSILSGQIAETFARRQQPALVVSLEMDGGEMAGRFVASVDRDRLKGEPLYLVDSAFDVGRICSVIKLARRKHGIDLAVLDYLQLAKSSNSKLPREQQVAEVSRALKVLALDLKIPIVAACQLNRLGEKEHRMPKISDLRESGSLEQDADIVLMLHHDETATKCVIGKQRNGPTGMIDLAFIGEKYRFENYAPDHALPEGF